MATPQAPSKPYFHNGQALSQPPLSIRVRNALDTAYVFIALYLISLFSLDPYTAAQASSFNPRNSNANARAKRPGWRGYGGGGSGSGSGPRGPPGGGGGGGGYARGRKLGGVDDIRGPECGSCG